MEQQDQYEQEIDLKDLMFSVLKKWRLILVVAFVFAVVLGGVKVFKGTQQLNDAEYIKKSRETQQTALEQYKLTKTGLTKEIENLQDSIKNQQEYQEKSILLNINPYDEYVATATLYVTTDYQIMPGMIYQNENIASSVLKAYMAIAQNGDMYHSIQKQMGQKVEDAYLKELINLEPDYYNNMMGITVIADTKNRAQDMLQSIMDSIESSHTDIVQSVGEHETRIVNQSDSVRVDLDLVNKQQEFSSNVKTLNETLTEKTTALKDLQEPKDEMMTKLHILKGSIKYAVLGGVLGAFMVVFFLCVAFLMSDKLVNERELKRRYDLMILGVVQRKETKKAFAWIDRWLERLEGRSERELEETKAYDIIAANASNYIGHANEILLVGTVGKEQLEKIQNALSSLLPGVRLTVGGNVEKDTFAIKKSAECDAVIVVEKRNASSFSNIQQELEFIHSLDKTVLGCIIL